ncbi:hypothetical protein SDC9_63247 [bioreactor metagenome]|uniref:Uncharacterized protein n=1 Tax=bioreactor metagenome TaxID=1076179 RepID=A0A644XL03_9ZZZZ
MTGVQTGRKRDCHGNRRELGLFSKSLADGIENDKSAVAEHRNRYHPAHEFHGKLGMFATHKPDDHLSKLESGSRLLQNGADQGSKDDDDADAAENAAESRADDTRDVLQWQADDDGKKQGDSHQGEERMDVPFRDGHDHDRDGDHKRDDQCNSRHEQPPHGF